jgi:hypothetical protein
MRKGKTQINKIRNKTGEITTNTKEIQGIIRDYFENLYSNTTGKSRRNGQIPFQSFSCWGREDKGE